MTISARPPSSADGSQTAGGLFRILFPLAMLVAVTALSFANAWPDSAVLDDKYFAGNEHLPEWSEPGEMFKGDLWRTPKGASGLYRPALLLSLSIDSQLFGDWLAGYHLSNIALHLVATLCLYGLLLHLLRAAPGRPPRADLYALLAALVFAAHPVHTEAVNSVFNRSDMLVTLFGVAGLWWLLHFLRTRPVVAWSGLGLAYLLAMLSKESGVVVPGLAVALILFLGDESWPRRIRRSLPVLWLLLPLALYAYLRTQGLSAGVTDGAADPGQSAGISSWVVNFDALADIVGLWGVALKLMVWPHPLKLHYDPPGSPVLLTLVVVQAAMLIVGLLQLRKGRSALLTGLAWFYLALLPASRLIAPADLSDPGLAERNLYLPSAGLTLTLAFALAWLGDRFGARRVWIPVLLAVLILMPLTWVRNNDWRTDVRLFEKEYRLSGAHPTTLRMVTAAHQKRGNSARGAEICDRHSNLIGGYGRFSHHCGLLYGEVGRLEDAEWALRRALEEEGERASIIGNLALVYVRMGRPADAAHAFQRAIKAEEDPALKTMRIGLMLAYLFPDDMDKLAQAKRYFDQAYEMQPLLTRAKVMSRMMEEAIEGDRRH